ncbi:helix-hairpin-helix domain-containing protein [Methanoplanus limicola]|uniref:Pathogenicity locus n=1 Tax=Methanoplanus limicola DSM 2279 TaxID=937775 RepID=H1YYW3_9EURY|nr:helix-hairpin-helix domain-containing protein [Methanoplanus limicola]EHQ37035.1 hypothetical protein Metlim_3003 [Methanoplanus limicola DSM 2279]
MTDNADKKKSLKDFRRIPGVGPSIAEDLYGLGYRSVSDLAGEIPEEMYERFCMMQGQRIDRCLLYVFRCAVYFAGNMESDYDPELLKWWSWKD